MALLAGCAAEKADLPGLTASPTPAATPSAPQPTPTERTATDLSDPELGIVFDDIPDLTGAAASAHDAAAIFEVENWRSTTTGSVSPALAPFVSPELLGKVEYGVQRNAEDGWLFQGTMHITLFDVIVDGATATVSVCSDYKEVLFVGSDGAPPQNVEELGLSRYERTTTRLSTFDDGVTWRPEDTNYEGESC